MKYNYTEIPNSLLEKLSFETFSVGELKVLICIARFTYGWHRDGAELSQRFLKEKTGLNKRNVSKILKRLEAKNVLRLISGIKSRWNAKFYLINMDYNEWNFVRPSDTYPKAKGRAHATGGGRAQERTKGRAHAPTPKRKKKR